MSVNAIHIQPMSFARANKLRQVTIQTLIALGIDPNSVSSEEEALALISKILSQRVEVAKPSKESSGSIAESEIISKAKNLASLVGIVLPEALPTDKMLEKISQKIDSLSQDATQNSKDFNQYKKEVESLKKEFSSLKQNENAMFATMNFNANMNKILLGL